MSYIYCITNHVNGKKYIGKTTSSVSKRWKEHCRDYKKERCKDRPLYRAMNKYGIDSFSIEMLEECSSKESSGRETYWINEFKTYGNGYNATTGGDGSIIWNYDEIRELYAAGHSMKDTAKIVGCHPDTVSKVVKDIKRSHNNSKSRCGSCKPPVKIEQYNEDILVQVFDSVADAAHWCVDNGYAKTYNGGVRSHISNAAKHKTKTAYGYRWEYAQ